MGLSGDRIAELLASELDGRTDGGLARLGVADADPDAEPSAEGTFAYRITAGGEPVGAVYLQPGRARIEFDARPDAALDAAREAGLRARPGPGKAVVFVEDGAEVKRAVDAALVLA